MNARCLVVPVVLTNEACAPETPEEFLEKLLAFWKAQDKPYIAPRMYKVPVNPHKLWHEVMSYGGYEEVCSVCQLPQQLHDCCILADAVWQTLLTIISSVIK